MKRFVILFSLVFTLPLTAQDKHPELLVLEPYIGTWSGEVAPGVMDVSKWEWVIGGKAIRILHSINNGAYGGESVLHWNNEKKAITYRYVTTARFYTEGTIEVKENGDLYVEEVVFGNMNGASATKSGYSVKDGKLHTWAQLKFESGWGEKSTSIYERTSDAEVTF